MHKILSPILLLILLFFTTSCSQQKLGIKSVHVPDVNTIYVFTPNNYDGQKSYPLLYLLHGWSGNYEQWNGIVDLQKIANENQFIIVCPDGYYDSWYVNSPLKKNSQYEKFFFNDLVKRIHTSFNIDTPYIFISGLSMGGFGAISLFLSRPDYFYSAGSTSGVLDIVPFAGKWGMDKLFSKEDYKKFSPINRLDDVRLKTKLMIIDCGVDDFGFEVNKLFFEKAAALKIPITFLAQPGAHTKEYWKNSITYHVKFFRDQIKQK